MAIEKKKDAGKEERGAAGSSELPAGTPITVHSYAGFKGDETPRSFEAEGHRLTVLRVIKTWKEEPEAGNRRKTFFRVHAHDGRQYDIAVDEAGQWTLETRRP
jgi:hypothetical protein